MKHLMIFFFCTIVLILPARRAHAQAQELEQLALDLQKLSQLKSILKEMYTGYQILTGGYNTIKSLTEGNFNLHASYLNGLLAVSPTIRNYARVADIITAQGTIVSEYKTALHNFQGAGVFNPTELNYLAGVYGNLVDRSVDNLDELLTVLTDSKLRMSDAERLYSVDHIYEDMQGKLNFLRDFNNKTGMLAAQRTKALQENATLQNLYQP